MRQHDGVGLGMRQIKRAAEGVAELVVQRHADPSSLICVCLRRCGHFSALSAAFFDTRSVLAAYSRSSRHC